MKIIDITRELFSVKSYPGDPIPKKEMWFSMENGNVCNLTNIKIGSHSGTHMDAPRHFIKDGKDAAEVDLYKCVGGCQVIHCNERTGKNVWYNKWNKVSDKLLFKGNLKISEELAGEFVRHKLNLIGVEDSMVGYDGCQEAVHKILLSSEIVILENLDLTNVEEGTYFLVAQPLKMKDVDGSAIRAILLKE